jgi:hypothetical protein
MKGLESFTEVYIILRGKQAEQLYAAQKSFGITT